MSKLLQEMENIIGCGKLNYNRIRPLKENVLIHNIYLEKIRENIFNFICAEDVMFDTINKRISNREFDNSFRIFLELENKNVTHEQSLVDSPYEAYEIVFLLYVFNDMIVLIHENSKLQFKFRFKVITENIEDYLRDKELIKVFL